MGTWGLGSFDNDDALDWVFELDDDKTALPFIKGLVVNEKTCDAEGIAACEVIYSAFYEPRIELPKEAKKWLKKDKTNTLASVVPHAVAFLNYVLSDESETAELWKASTNHEMDTWRADIVFLRDHLRLVQERLGLQDTGPYTEIPPSLFPEFDRKIFITEIMHHIDLVVEHIATEFPELEIYSVCVSSWPEGVMDGKKIISQYYTESFVDTESRYQGELARLRAALKDPQLEHGRWDVCRRFAKTFLCKLTHSQRAKRGKEPKQLIADAKNSLVGYCREQFAGVKLHPDARISLDGGNTDYLLVSAKKA